MTEELNALRLIISQETKPTHSGICKALTARLLVLQ